MSSLLNSTYNTRQLVPGSFRYLRSDVPDKLTESEIQWLLRHDVRTVVDLRSPQELQKRHCPLMDHPQFSYYSMPVTTGDIVPHCFEDVSCSYLDMVDDQLVKIIRLIENAPTNVLYFCNAGKDRTGVVSAILLLRMGADRHTIVENYTESAANLKEMLAEFVAKRPDLDLTVVTPRAWTMEQFLDRLPEKACFPRLEKEK